MKKKIEWRNTDKVKLAAPGFYRLAWTEWREDGYKINIEKKLWQNPPEYCFGKLIRRRGISYDVCLAKNGGWGWTHNIPDIKTVMAIIKNRQAESINGF